MIDLFILFFDKNFVIVYLFIISLYGYFTPVSLPFSIVQVDAICPNGYYKSHTTDCERKEKLYMLLLEIH